MGRTAAAKDTFMTEAQKKSLEKLNMFPTTMEVVPRIHTGIYGLDIALGGGFPVRRVTEISGLNHSGKTTVALIAAASVIAEGGRVAYIDGEHALDKKWVLQYIPEDEIYWGEGFLENTSFHVYEPDYLEQGLEGMRELVNLYDLVIYDSIGGSPTRAFVEAAVGDQFYAPVARIMGIFKGVIAHDVKHGNAAVVFLNHVTTMIGGTINALLPYGGIYKPAGGEGMGFVSSIRLMMGNPEKLDTPKQLVDTLKKEFDDAKFVYGKKLKGQIFKNKLHAAPRSFDFNLINYPYTFYDRPEDIKDAAKQIGVLDQRGAYWYFEGEQVAPNNDAMKAYIASDEGIVIEDALKAKIRLLWAGEENADEPTKEFIRETTDPSL